MSEPAWLKILVDICAIAGAAVGVATAILALRTFQKNAGIRHAEWLKTLHTQFYESPAYSDVRRILDYQHQPEFDKLRASVTHGDRESEGLGLYLNFFELIASLWKLDQLTLQEIRMLFDYYILLLARDDLKFVRDYIDQWGFENLRDMIEAVRKERGK